MKDLKIGIQLYTVRAPLKQDFKGVLRDLAKLGCDAVEFAFDFGGMEPAELAAFVRSVGLSVCGIHASLEEWTRADAPVFDYAEALGCRYVTASLPGPFTAGRVEDEVIPGLLRASGQAAERGRCFTYHNHAEEFARIGEKHALDLIFDRTAAGGVKCELDVYWIRRGGEDPVAYIRRYADRLPQLHLKDMDGDDGSYTELGRGVIDIPGCLAAAREAATEWVIYEQDVCRRPQFESAEISLKYLKKLV